MPIPTQAEIEAMLRGDDLDSWLEMWRTEQGPAKPAALRLLAAAIPFPRDRSLRVLDAGCGPGDAGRTVHARYPEATLDCVDRNSFFAALCGSVNRRDRIRGRTWVGDLADPGWRREVESGYDVVVTANAVHWFSLEGAARLLADLFQMLRSGGVLLLMEPAAAERPFMAGVEVWRKEQPSQHRCEDWRRFWSRVQSLVGCDYGFLGEPGDQDRIGDSLPVMRWAGLLADAGFASVDVLLRDAEKAALAAIKP